MYLYAVEFLAKRAMSSMRSPTLQGPGFASRHNLKYWTLGEYAGFGPGAYSDFGGVRYGYMRDLDAVIAGDLCWRSRKGCTHLEREMEYVMLRLRTAEGLESPGV